MPNFDTLIFTLDDVRAIRGDVSVNIDDFNQYAVEAQRNYLSKLLGDKLYTARLNDLEGSRFVDLIEGVIYQDGGNEVIFRGVKIYISYIWLYLYLIGSNSSLTPIGARIFKDDFAIEAYNRKETQDNANHFIKSADGMEDSILRFLNRKRDIYPEFSQSKQIQQADQDNIQFRSSGSTWFTPNNFVE